MKGGHRYAAIFDITIYIGNTYNFYCAVCKCSRRNKRNCVWRCDRLYFYNSMAIEAHL